MKKRCCIFVLVFLLLLPCVVCSGQDTVISVDEIIKNLQTEFALIQDYSVRLFVVVDMKNVRVPPREIKMYFKQPDKIHMEAEGFAMLPREGVIINPNQFNNNDFYMSFLGEEVLRGIRTYKIELVPRNDSIKIRKFNLWVDPGRWLVLSVFTLTWQGQSAQVDIQYDMFEEKYRLPVKAVARVNLKGFMGFSGFHGGSRNEESGDDNLNENAGKVFLEFHDYEINKGIPDSMFSK